MNPDQAAWEQSDRDPFVCLQINLLCKDNVKQAALLIYHIRRKFETNCFILINGK